MRIPVWLLVLLCVLALPGLLVWEGWLEAWFDNHNWKFWERPK
jgi:hypothetical protein